MTRLQETETTQLDLSLDDLIGKQSVRATFRLPPEAIDLLGIIAGQLGIKKKSLFDQLIENNQTLQEIAREAQQHVEIDQERRQKTFVISRSSLQSLNAISEEKEVSRDLLVELSIRRLLPVIRQELKKHAKRKQLQKEMAEYLKQGKKLLDKSAQLLGKDDQLYQMMKNQMTVAQKNFNEIQKIVEKGMAMEKW